MLRPDPQLVLHSHSPLGNLTVSTFKIHARLPVTDHSPLLRAGPAHQHLPLVAAAAPRWPSPRPHCRLQFVLTWQQGRLLKLGLNRAVGSKPSRTPPFPLAAEPCCGSPAFHDLQPTPSSSSYLASSSSPVFSCPSSRHSPTSGACVCASLWCTAFLSFPHGSLTPQVSSDVTLT